jgi:hypothetical protein
MCVASSVFASLLASIKVSVFSFMVCIYAISQQIHIISLDHQLVCPIQFQSQLIVPGPSSVVQKIETSCRKHHTKHNVGVGGGESYDFSVLS